MKGQQFLDQKLLFRDYESLPTLRTILTTIQMNTILSLVNSTIDESNRKEAIIYTIIYTIIYKQITSENKVKEDSVTYFPECFHFIADGQNNGINNGIKRIFKN